MSGTFQEGIPRHPLPDQHLLKAQHCLKNFVPISPPKKYPCKCDFSYLWDPSSIICINISIQVSKRSWNEKFGIFRSWKFKIFGITAKIWLVDLLLGLDMPDQFNNPGAVAIHGTKRRCSKFALVNKGKWCDSEFYIVCSICILQWNLMMSCVVKAKWNLGLRWLWGTC